MIVTVECGVKEAEKREHFKKEGMSNWSTVLYVVKGRSKKRVDLDDLGYQEQDL